MRDKFDYTGRIVFVGTKAQRIAVSLCVLVALCLIFFSNNNCNVNLTFFV